MKKKQNVQQFLSQEGRSEAFIDAPWPAQKSEVHSNHKLSSEDQERALLALCCSLQPACLWALTLGFYIHLIPLGQSVV